MTQPFKPFPRKGAYIDVDSDPDPEEGVIRYTDGTELSTERIMAARDRLAADPSNKSGLPPKDAPSLYGGNPDSA